MQIKTKIRDYLTRVRMVINQKAYKQQMPERVEKREPSFTAGGKVNWFSHYGEKYRVSKKLKSCQTIQQSHSQAYIWKRLEL